MRLGELQTPALLLDLEAFEHNLSIMAKAFPGPSQRPHVKAHKSTAIAKRQHAYGHTGFTCATIREVEVLAAAGLGEDLLLANEVADARRLGVCVDQTGAKITLAVDSADTVAAAAAGGVQHVIIDVNIGLPRCGVDPEQAGALADLARSKGLNVRGVMGYEGHLMMVMDRAKQLQQVRDSFELLLRAHGDVGGEIVSGGGTGTFAIHQELGVLTEIQCGSYALMDTQYVTHNFGFKQAIYLLATVISVAAGGWAVADCGLKANGMDHGNPSIAGADVLFCSDEHITFIPNPAQHGLKVGDRILVTPAHCDPTVAYHEQYWTVPTLTQPGLVNRADLGDVEVTDQWRVDMRAW
jgi:D-threonine aldolase